MARSPGRRPGSAPGRRPPSTPGRRLVVVAALALIAWVAAGCGLLEPGQDTSLPQLLAGRVVDANGAPIAGARVTVVVPARNAGPDAPPVWTAEARTDDDGRFAIHAVPPEALLQYAVTYGTNVGFDLSAVDGSGSVVATGHVQRVVTDGGWLGEIPDVSLSPTATG